jgi:ankyrin repeat protein
MNRQQNLILSFCLTIQTSLTPLMVASENNELEIIDALLEKGAKVNIQDDLGIYFVLNIQSVFFFCAT